MNAKKTRVAILISGRGSNMRSLVERGAGAQIFRPRSCSSLVNKAEAEGLAFAQERGIATAVVDHKAFSGREDFERVDAGETAGRIASSWSASPASCACSRAWFVEQWRGRMLNIHPALLPSYRGLHTHERALADGVKIHGARCISSRRKWTQARSSPRPPCRCSTSDTPDTLAARVLEQEHRIYPLALSRVASGAARVEGFRVRIAGEPHAPAALIWPTN